MAKDKTEQMHIFVKYGSKIIDEKIGKIEEMFDLKYLHKHNGSKPEYENKNLNYNKNMKIKPCAIYKFKGNIKNFNKLVEAYNNLEIITDNN